MNDRPWLDSPRPDFFHDNLELVSNVLNINNLLIFIMCMIIHQIPFSM
jgi:hypothetical protein